MAFNRSWIYTPEQAKKIINGDISARNKFFFDNYDRLRVMAKSFVATRYCLSQMQYDVDDLLMQVYLDLPYIEYKSPAALTFDIKKKSFRLSVFGGYAFFVVNRLGWTDKKRFQLSVQSTDEVKRGETSDSFTLWVDNFCSCSPFDEFFERSDGFEYQFALRSVLSRYLKPLQVEFVILVCEGYSQAEACRKIGVRSMSFSSLCKRLKSHSAEIVDGLLDFGCSAAEKYWGVSPSEKPPQRVFKLSPEERAKAAARQRVRRAQKRLGKLAAAPRS